MILIDSSVWIDFLRENETSQTDALSRLIVSRPLATADLVLAEVLQGCRTEREFWIARQQLSLLTPIVISDHHVAEEAARNYRFLRAKGITVRKTIDVLIATRCIMDDLPLLYSDRDFDPFVEHLGLESALDLGSGVN